MLSTKQKLGAEGEKIALKFLAERGLKILATNFKTKFGEIDIVAKDKDAFVFVEVKTRNPESFGTPQDAIDELKTYHLIRAAEIYLDENNIGDTNWRIDVVAIKFNAFKNPDIEHFVDAVEDIR